MVEKYSVGVIFNEREDEKNTIDEIAAAIQTYIDDITPATEISS